MSKLNQFYIHHQILKIMGINSADCLPFLRLLGFLGVLSLATRSTKNRRGCNASSTLRLGSSPRGVGHSVDQIHSCRHEC